MTKVDLKNLLIQKISEIDDLQFLEAIKTILDAKSDKTIVLNKDQKDEIIASQKEVVKGLFIEQKQLDQDIHK